VDVTALLFPNFRGENNSANKKAFGGFFFMVTPYIQDFVAARQRNKLPKLASGLGPCLGVAMFQVLGEMPKPVYFLGVSARISDGFRLNAGLSVFKNDKNDRELQGMFGFGASLHIAYVGDLLRLLTTATTTANGFSTSTTTVATTSTNPNP
jgi:hypothetical protein